MLAAGLLLSLGGCEKEPKAYVECKPIGATIGEGLACTIEHKQGSVAVEACWRVLMTCANGHNVTATKCGTVAPEGKSVVAIRAADLVNAELCDAVTATSLDSMRLTAKR